MLHLSGRSLQYCSIARETGKRFKGEKWPPAHFALYCLTTLYPLSQDDSLVAYQLAFDLYDGATQHFLRKVHEVIRASLPAPPKATPTTQEGEVLSTPVQETG